MAGASTRFGKNGCIAMFDLGNSEVSALQEGVSRVVLWRIIHYVLHFTIRTVTIFAKNYFTAKGDIR